MPNTDHFKIMCDELDKNYQKSKNEITCVKEYFESEKIFEDYDRLLKIKAEAEERDSNSYYSLVVCVISMFFTGVGCIAQIFNYLYSNLYFIGTVCNIMYIVICLIFLCIFYIRFISKRKYESVYKWKKYVLVIVNDYIASKSKKELEKIDKGKYHQTKQLKKRSSKKRKNKKSR